MVTTDRPGGADDRVSGRHAVDADRDRRTRGQELGQAIVELAIVAPVLLLVLLATAQFGTILATQIGITNAVREAAREASVVPTTTADAAGVNGAWASDRLRSVLLPGAPSYDAARLVTSGDQSTEVCYRQATDVVGAPEVLVQVRAAYRHALWLPVISEILDGIDGAHDGALSIAAVEEIRVENVATPALGGTVCAP